MEIFTVMNRRIFLAGIVLTAAIIFSSGMLRANPIRVLVITGGHGYQEQQFNQMFSELGEDISFKVVPFPDAFSMFLPENRDQYDVLVFYHMWQEISDQEARNMSECIKKGKPLVVLHHSICAFDNWPEYTNIIGGKYFHKATVVNGKEYPASTYKHDIKFMVKIVDPNHPVTKGLHDFEIADESYYGFYVDPGVTPLLTTVETTSTPVIGWAKKYGKARVVTLQSGHDELTFGNPGFRTLLKQSIEWVMKVKK
jgi:uncharacterized protein